MASGDSALLLHLQTEVLEAIAYGEPLAAIADLLCRRAEALAPGAICSILAVERGGTLRTLASPSLPAFYTDAINGMVIGPSAGCCGTAAYRNEPVLVTDIARDPLWDGYRALVEPIGLKACWSSPIAARDGSVVATFAFYYKTNRGPDEMERMIVQTCVHLCAIAIEHEQVQARNHRLAYFDTLTGLPNRGQFERLLGQTIGADAPFGLLFIDIDHVKTVNDTMGQMFGDLLIRTVAQRIAHADPSMIACRLGADEFAVLVANCASARDLGHAAQKLLVAIRGSIAADPHTIDPHVTIGGALFGPDGTDADTLCQNADFALYHAKQANRGGYARFRPGLRTATVERFNVVRAVDLALAENRILPYYQPIVRLDTAEIVGLEALARMRAPDGRIVSAGEFHAALSDPRISCELTGQMLTAVARDVRQWLDAGIAFQHVGFNVTTGDFLQGDLETRIGKAFDDAGVPLAHVILEVNEAVYMGDSDNMVPRAVEALRKRGLRVALDDFGTGFASLTHLLSFPVDIIKIDKSFIDRLVADRNSTVVVGAIVDIARKLEMKVVAEGIETAEQAGYLADLGCNLGQGYLFSRPCSNADITDLLRRFAEKPQDLPQPAKRRA